MSTNHRVPRLLAAVVLCTLAALPAHAQDWWPMFGRDLGHRADTTCPAPTEDNVLWDFQTSEEILGAPVIVDGWIYFLNEGGSLFCLDRGDGSLQWSVNLYSRYTNTTPAVVDGYVYAATYDAEIYCYDTYGNFWWQTALPGSQEIRKSSPVIYGGKLYIGTNADRVYCLDASDGSIVWWFDSDGQVQTSVAIDEGYGCLYVTTLQGGSPDNVFCLPLEDPDANGEITSAEVLWSYRADDSIASTPVLHEDCVYFVDYQGTLYRLYADPDLDDNYREGGKWPIATGACWGAPTVHEQWMCFGSEDHFVYMVDPYNGNVRWKYDTGGNVWTAPAFADDKVYVASGSEDWKLYCFDYRSGDLLWLDQTYLYQEGSPAIADGVLYIGETGGNQGRMVAFADQGTVTVSAYPGLMPQDAFPAQGFVDLVNLETNFVRFDAARDPDLTDMVNSAVDRVTFRVRLTAPGAELQFCQLRYRMRPNPLFENQRSEPPEGLVMGTIIEKSLLPYAVYECRYDLPDSSLLFPGDVLHYFVEASDATTNATLPADTTGYSDFNKDSPYDRRFTFRALPSVPQPRILVLDYAESEERGLDRALWELGFLPGDNYDSWYRQAARSNVGNCLAARASTALLGGYETILVDCGDGFVSLGNDPDHGADVDSLLLWQNQPAVRRIAHWGANVASMLSDSPVYLAEMGVTVLAADATTVGSWVNPGLVPSVPPVLTFASGNFFSATGPTGRLHFDELMPAAVAVVTHDLVPQPPATPIAGGILHDRVLDGYRKMAFTMPLPLSSLGWVGEPSPGMQMTAQATLLQELLEAFEGGGGGAPPTRADPLPERAVLHPIHPNPFNPHCTVSFLLPHEDLARVEVFDLRGRRLRVLLEERRPAGPNAVVFDGRDDAGHALASGVYFIRLEAEGTTQVRKAALVR